MAEAGVLAQIESVEKKEYSDPTGAYRSTNPDTAEAEESKATELPRGRKRIQGRRPNNKPGIVLKTKDFVEGHVETRRSVFRTIKNSLRGKFPTLKDALRAALSFDEFHAL